MPVEMSTGNLTVATVSTGNRSADLLSHTAALEGPFEKAILLELNVVNLKCSEKTA
jgi:hypothetical protein